MQRTLELGTEGAHADIINAAGAGRLIRSSIVVRGRISVFRPHSSNTTLHRDELDAGSMTMLHAICASKASVQYCPFDSNLHKDSIPPRSTAVRQVGTCQSQLGDLYLPLRRSNVSSISSLKLF